MFSAKSVVLRDKVSVCLVLRVWRGSSYLGTRLVCV